VKLNSRRLTRYIILAMLFGTLGGVFFPQGAIYFSWLGTVFQLSLSMIVTPIIVTSILSGMGNLGDVRQLGDMGSKAVSFYIVTTFIAILTGLFLVFMIKPGVHLPADEVQEQMYALESSHEGMTENILAHIRLTQEGWKTENELELKNQLLQLQQKNSSDTDLQYAALRYLGSMKYRAILSDNHSAQAPEALSLGEFFRSQLKKLLINPFQALAEQQILAIIFFSFLFGAALSSLGKRSREIFNLIDTAYEAMTVIVRLVLLLIPFGVFGLIYESIADMGFSIFQELSLYALCILLGLGIHLFLTLPTLCTLFSGRDGWAFLRQIKEVLMVAFSSSSTKATLPVAMACAENELKIPAEVARFSLPLGASLNMNGTALYEAVAAVFIAQLYGVDLSLYNQFIIVLTAALAAIGAAGIPAAGTVTMAMVLSAVGLPLEAIGLLLVIDRPLDMCRTVINVAGDLYGCQFVNHHAKSIGVNLGPTEEPSPSA